MQLPPKFILSGDKRAAQDERKNALNFLHRALATCNPTLMVKGPFTLRFNDGSIYQVSEVYGQKFVSIFVPHRAVVETAQKEQDTKKQGRQGGTLYAVGNNAYGQLGTGDTTNLSGFTEIQTPFTPQQVQANGRFAAVLDTGGNLYVCGRNNKGQLGLGDYQDRHAFTPVTLPGEDFVIQQISLGEDFLLVLNDQGGLYGCGSHELGQLALGSPLTTYSTLQFISSGWHYVSGGTGYTLGIKTDRTMWAVGLENMDGVMGIGYKGDERSEYDTIRDNGWGANYHFRQIVAGSNDGSDPGAWEKVYALGRTTFALRNGGELWCCGFNGYRQLGDGDWSSAPFQLRFFTRTALGVGGPIKDVSGGWQHTIIIDTDNIAYGAGYTSMGAISLFPDKEGSSGHVEVFTQVDSGYGGVNPNRFMFTDGGIEWTYCLGVDAKLYYSGMGTAAAVGEFTDFYDTTYKRLWFLHRYNDHPYGSPVTPLPAGYQAIDLSTSYWDGFTFAILQ